MDFSESVVPLCGESHISGVLLNIAALEAQTENGYIRMLVQPDFTSFFEQLNHIILKKDALTIEHIMCFNNNPEIPIQSVTTIFTVSKAFFRCTQPDAGIILTIIMTISYPVWILSTCFLI